MQNTCRFRKQKKNPLKKKQWLVKWSHLLSSMGIRDNSSNDRVADLNVKSWRSVLPRLQLLVGFWQTEKPQPADEKESCFWWFLLLTDSRREVCFSSVHGGSAGSLRGSSRRHLLLLKFWPPFPVQLDEGLPKPWQRNTAPCCRSRLAPHVHELALLRWVTSDLQQTPLRTKKKKKTAFLSVCSEPHLLLLCKPPPSTHFQLS